jgi:GDP-4-dehydro-6-deoxy-D-mannose reductase
MRVLVTGGAGFLGSHMAVHLSENGQEVTATHRPGSSVPVLDRPSGLRWIPLELADPTSVAATFDAVRPEVVYHFGGQPYVQPSWEDPGATFRTNFTGTLRLLQQIRTKSPKTVFAFAGSGTEYGSAEQIPTGEEAPLLPTSPYAASKAAADLLCYQYFRSFDIPVFRFRIFGATGWGKRGDAVNDFASQVAKAERSPAPRVLRAGNLDTERDVMDVRDAVRAMVTVTHHGEPGLAYNIATGVPRSVRKTLETLVSLAAVPISVETDPGRLRRVDELRQLADASRLRALGWAPEVPFERTLHDVLEGWRAAAAAPTLPVG